MLGQEEGALREVPRVQKHPHCVPGRVSGGRGGGGGEDGGDVGVGGGGVVPPCLSFPSEQVPTYSCTVCLPMGAWRRKSREMGLIHITSTRTGARKLRWSRTLRRSCQRPPQSSGAPHSLHPPPWAGTAPHPRPLHPLPPPNLFAIGAQTPQSAITHPIAPFPTHRCHPTGSGACRPPSAERRGASGPGAAPGRSGRRPGRSTGPPAPA